MKNRILYFLLTAYTSFVLGGCDIAYKYDIESGTDDYTSDKADANIDTDSSIDVSMYAQARIFPGLVDTTREEHVDATITLDLTKRYVDASTLGMQWVPAAVYSTGLYAGAGELITIQLDEDVMGLSVQIGSHTDDLTTVNSFLREPVVYTTKALFPGINTVRNPLGGTIWILKNQWCLQLAGLCAGRDKPGYFIMDGKGENDYCTLDGDKRRTCDFHTAYCTCCR